MCEQKNRSVLYSIALMRCPRCRQGKLFSEPTYKLKYLFRMPEHCECCGQKTELELGFYYGANYVSYALNVALIVATTVALFVFGVLTIESFLIVATSANIILSPYIVRFSRTMWIHIFVKRDKNAIAKHQQAKKMLAN